MGNSLLNWRFGMWHLQVNRDFPYFRFSRNDYHAPEYRPAGWKWFERY